MSEVVDNQTSSSQEHSESVDTTNQVSQNSDTQTNSVQQNPQEANLSNSEENLDNILNSVKKEFNDLYGKPNEESKTENLEDDEIPETYTFDGIEKEYQGTVSPDDKALAADIAKSLGLTKKQANTLFKDGGAILVKAQQQARAKVAKGWLNEIVQDPEIGGNNFNNTKTNLSRFMNKYADKETVDFLENSYLGSHPALVRLFNRIGADLSEETKHVRGEVKQEKPNPYKAIYGY